MLGEQQVWHKLPMSVGHTNVIKHRDDGCWAVAVVSTSLSPTFNQHQSIGFDANDKTYDMYECIAAALYSMQDIEFSHIERENRFRYRFDTYKLVNLNYDALTFNCITCQPATATTTNTITAAFLAATLSAFSIFQFQLNF